METIPSSEVFFKSLGPVALEGKTDTEELFEVYWTGGAEYDAIRRSLTPISAPGDGISGFASMDSYGAPRLRLNAARACHAILLSARHLVATLHATRAMAAAKAAMVVVVYLTIAAGMVWSRADTKQPAIRENPPAAKPIETPSTLTAEEGISDSSQPAGMASLSENITAIPDQPVKSAEPLIPPDIEPPPQMDGQT